MSKNLYMHTMDGKPAYYDGFQVVYAGKYAPFEKLFVESLDKIKEQRIESAENREKEGWDILIQKSGGKFVEMGYLRVKIH